MNAAAMQISIGMPMVFVPDLEQAERFYCDVLGLSLVERDDDRVLVRGADFDLVLFPCDTKRSHEGHASIAGSALAFQVDNLESAIASLRAADVTLRAAHATMGGGDACDACADGGCDACADT